MKCTICGKEFDGRADAKFCSASCRKKASRLKEPLAQTPAGIKKMIEEKVPPKNISTRVSDPNLLGEEDIPKGEWYDPFTPVEPIMDVFQPVNGDVMCNGEILKGVYPKGTGTEQNLRKYSQHATYHQKTCNPQPEPREAVR